MLRVSMKSPPAYLACPYQFPVYLLCDTGTRNDRQLPSTWGAPACSFWKCCYLIVAQKVYTYIFRWFFLHIMVENRFWCKLCQIKIHRSTQGFLFIVVATQRNCPSVRRKVKLQLGLGTLNCWVCDLMSRYLKENFLTSWPRGVYADILGTPVYSGTIALLSKIALVLLDSSIWLLLARSVYLGPLLQHGLTLISAWISNYIHYSDWSHEQFLGGGEDRWATHRDNTAVTRHKGSWMLSI